MLPLLQPLSLLNYRRSVVTRFIARRHDSRQQTPGSIDEVKLVDGTPGLLEFSRTTDVPRGAPYYVRGWAVDLGRKALPWDLRIAVDEIEVPAQIRRKLPRADIARAFANAALLPSGFEVLVSTKYLTVGPHILTIRAIVGRFGSAFARIPSTLHFFIVDTIRTALAPSSRLQESGATYELEPIGAVCAGSVLAVTGWALDDAQQPFITVAAQIDDSAWSEGWMHVQQADSPSQTTPSSEAGAFTIRVRLDKEATGVHTLRLAGKTRDGRWLTIGLEQSLMITTTSIQSRGRALVDSGSAIIIDADEKQLTQLIHHRVGKSIVIAGRLRRSTPVGLPVALTARGNDGTEHSLTGWSGPSPDPKLVRFGAKIQSDELLPGIYRLIADAPDMSHRFVGRCDTGCDLIVKRRAALNGEKLID